MESMRHRRQEHVVNIAPQAQKEITNRLRRARGQIDGVISMIESGRSCREVVTQLSAASSALDRAGYKLIAISMKECLLTADDEREMTPDELERLFITLA
jgi:DNA-binding FrmR family transcriptional regulator